MMRTIAVTSALALALGGFAPSGALAAAPAAQDGSAAERKICRTTKMTGSLTRRTRICLTEAQWRELNARTRRGVDEMTSVASGGKECVQDPSGGCR